MARDPALLLERLSGRTPRRYSTFAFGRARDEQCLSVVVPEGEARPLAFALRKQLPTGFVAFVGTTRWYEDERHKGKAEVVLGKGESQFDILRPARTDACNFDLDTEDLIEKLRSWDRSFGTDVLEKMAHRVVTEAAFRRSLLSDDPDLPLLGKRR